MKLVKQKKKPSVAGRHEKTAEFGFNTAAVEIA